MPDRRDHPSAPAVEVVRAREVATAALDALAPRLVRAAGDVATEPKADGTPVTEVDRAADDHLTDALLTAFPAHGVLSEERATRSPDTAWTWVVDPIDGTSNFASGLPYWCVSVALTYEGAPVLGIVDAPALGRRYVAVAGAGGVREDRMPAALDATETVRRRRLAVRSAVDWRDRRFRHVPVMLTTGTARRARAAGLALNVRVLGSVALDLAAVAEGTAATSIARVPRAWDVAAGWVMVEEAGGQVVTVGRSPLLPLRPDVEHADRWAITAAGSDAASVTDLANALLGTDATGRTRA